MNTAENKALWAERARLGETAGTQDLILKQLEQRAIFYELRKAWRRAAEPKVVLEVGCGRGETARLFSKWGATVMAIDNSSAMIRAAEEESDVVTPDRQPVYFRCDEIDAVNGQFAAIYTQRMLINLPNWDTQRAMLQKMADRLRKGGRLILCESSIDGCAEVNARREQCGLPRYYPPAHTYYLLDCLMEWNTHIPRLRYVRTVRFSHFYYLLSRVVNAKLAQWQGTEPRYDAWINKLALYLPMIDGSLAQTKIFVYERI